MISQNSPSNAESADKQTLLSRLEAMKQAIWRRRPILGEIIQKHGADTLYDYSQDFLDVNKSPRLDGRRHELITIAKTLITKRLGADVAEGVAKQLTKLPLVSTADHHGPITHPFFVNADMISAIPYVEDKDPDIQYLPVFSFATVSVNNTSFPRGILFHGGEQGAGAMHRLPILPDKLKMGVVYGMRSFTREDLTKAEVELQKKEKAGDIAPGRGQEIRQMLGQYFGNDEILSDTDFCSQITKINYRLWPAIFHPARTEGSAPRSSGLRMPDLVYLEIETLVTDVLFAHHIPNKDSLLHKVLFDPTFQQAVLVHFNNLPGAFSLENKWGTHLFWGIDEKFHRVRLVLENGRLASHDGEHSFSFTPEGITAALREKKIFPSMLLCYLVVSLYYGMKCLGGFSQVHDLTMVKEAWGKFLAAMNEKEEAEAIVPVQTKELGGDGMVLAYLHAPQGEMVPATGIDMILDDGDTTYEKYIALSKRITMAEAMNPLLPEIYIVLYPSHERDPELAKITGADILRITGLSAAL